MTAVSSLRRAGKSRKIWSAYDWPAGDLYKLLRDGDAVVRDKLSRIKLAHPLEHLGDREESQPHGGGAWKETSLRRTGCVARRDAFAQPGITVPMC